MEVTRAYIKEDNIKKNLDALRLLVHKDTKICVPVKANAYGHGAVFCAQAFLKNGADMLAVARVSEGIELRKAGIKVPLLLFSVPSQEELEELVLYDITPFVFEKDFIKSLDSICATKKRTCGVHLKIDTGMGRIGCTVENASSIASCIANTKWLKLEGTCTHFSVSDSLVPEDISFTNVQIEKFKTAIQSIRNCGINPGICHCSATGGTLLYSEAQFDMIRPGLAAYGYFPCYEIKKAVQKKNTHFNLYPVMELVTTITSLKTIEKGMFISYGKKWESSRKTKIATLPIGYADGLKRCLTPGLRVCIRGSLYPVVGRICMDQCMVDIGLNNDIKKGDDVVIFSDKEGVQSLEEQAEIAHSIPYEILCGIAPRVPRIAVINIE